MATPCSLDVMLGLPGTPGLPVSALPFMFRGSYEVKGEFEYKLPASTGTVEPDFTTQPDEGLKVLVLYYEPLVGAPPIGITLNGADTPFELTSGGFFAYSSPTPVAGIVSVLISHTGAGRVRGWLLG